MLFLIIKPIFLKISRTNFNPIMKLLLKISAFAIVFCLSAPCFAQSKKEQTEFKKTAETILKDWNEAPDGFDEYEQANTYLMDLGIRGKYYLNKELLSLAKVAQLMGETVYNSGPHDKEMNLTSGSFGHYNPKFLKKLQKNLTVLLADKKFVKKAQPLYDKQLKKYLQCFWHSYQHVIAIESNKKAAVAAYNSFIAANASEAGYNMQEHFRDFTDKYESFDYDWYEMNTTAVFWTRRAMDGTDKEFSSLMRLMIQTFDKSFLLKKD